jgi:hypothetical protein
LPTFQSRHTTEELARFLLDRGKGHA